MNETLEQNRSIPADVWQAGLGWAEYFTMLEKLLAEGKTTGQQQTPERLEHARLNLLRMKRIYEQFNLDTESVSVFEKAPKNLQLLMIVEGWCGDAAQIVPALQKIAEKMGWETRYILRDEYPEIMNMFLTNGARSIPAVVALTPELKVMGKHWGPRPALLIDLVNNWKAEMSKEDWHKLMHTWYAKDKGNTLQADFGDWVKQLSA